jgi:glycosyltransferase involved in cell wall biosynthesis
MTDPSPVISVMMPCYNNAAFIEAAVTSILNQRIDVPLELLIIDDASGDDSVDRIGRIRDDRIRLIRNRENRGIARVRNQLLAEARGAYVSSLDGDDVYVDDQKLACEWNLLHRDPRPDRTIVYSDVRWIDGRGETMLLASSIAPPMEGRLYQAILDRRVMIPRDFLLSAELARSVGGFDPELPIYEDWDYKLRLAQRATWRYTHRVGIGYRRHGGGLSAAEPRLHERCQTMIRQKHAGAGFDGDPMRQLSLAARLHGILTRNRLQQRKAA